MEWFRVKRHPHMGLNLVVGKIYCRERLEYRCKKSIPRLVCLEILLQDANIFEPMFLAPAVTDVDTTPDVTSDATSDATRDVTTPATATAPIKTEPFLRKRIQKGKPTYKTLQ